MTPDTQPPLRVAIVDDQQMLLDGLSELLNGCPELEVCGTALNGEDALRLFEQDCPDIVLLDISMPGREGTDVLLDLRARFSQIRTIMLTVDDDPNTITTALRRGAWGYILKKRGRSELLKAILQVAGGSYYLDPEVLIGVFPPDFPQPGAMPGHKRPVVVQADEDNPMSLREREVLGLLSEGKTSEEIGKHLFLSVNTVDTHRKNIISKLGARNIADAVRIALQRGYI